MILFKPRRLFLIISTVLIACNSYSQDGISAFLKSSTNDINLDLYENQIELLSKKSYRKGAIQGLQLRAQNNELGSEENEFSLRITPSNPWEIRNNNRLFKSYKKALTLEQDLKLKEILQLRYLLVNLMVYQQEIKRLKAEANSNINNQISILEKQSESSFFDAEDYVDLKLEDLKGQTELEEIDFKLNQLSEDILKEDPDLKITPSEWTIENIISVNKISQIADSLLYSELYTTTTSFYKERINMSNYDYKLEKNNLNLGFIQPEYNPYRKREEGENQLGLSFGINIPLFNPNKGDMMEKKLDRIEAESELAIETKIAKDEVGRLSNSLKNYITRYNNIQQKIGSFTADKTFETVSTLNSNNPIIYLKFNEQILKLKLLQTDIALEIYNSYINLLAAADLLQQRPLLNFLSKDLQEL